MRIRAIFFLISFTFLGFVVEAAPHLKYPNPVVHPKVVDSQDTEVLKDNLRLYAANYMRAFINEFLELNGLNQNLFAEQLFIDGVNKAIDDLTPKEVLDPRVGAESFTKMRRELINMADLTYPPNVAARIKAEVKNLRYDQAVANRIDNMEKRLNELSNVNVLISDLNSRVDSLENRIGSVEQRPGGSAAVAAAVPIKPVAQSNGLAWAAIVLAACSLLYQFSNRKRS